MPLSEPQDLLVVALVKEFLLTELRCPPAWRPFDLYLFRDDAVAFYVGQSYIHYAPCFNVTLNARPTPLPAQYAPPGQRITCSRSLTKLINQASIVVKADNRRKWLELETTVQA